jgi:hypothetical protein
VFPDVEPEKRQKSAGHDKVLVFGSIVRNTDGAVSTTTSILVPAGALLETWSDHEWSNGVMVDRMTSLHRLTIRTRHSLYEIVVVAPETGDVLVRGGEYFPEFTPARLAGSSLGGSFLKLHGIYVGFRMELSDGARMIVTSPVQEIAFVDLAPQTM